MDTHTVLYIYGKGKIQSSDNSSVLYSGMDWMNIEIERSDRVLCFVNSQIQSSTINIRCSRGADFAINPRKLQSNKGSPETRWRSDKLRLIITLLQPNKGSSETMPDIRGTSTLTAGYNKYFPSTSNRVLSPAASVEMTNNSASAPPTRLSICTSTMILINHYTTSIV